jgi:hypothetical protein
MALNQQYEPYAFAQETNSSLREREDKSMNKSTKFILKTIIKEIDKIT